MTEDAIEELRSSETELNEKGSTKLQIKMVKDGVVSVFMNE